MLMLLSVCNRSVTTNETTNVTTCIDTVTTVTTVTTILLTILQFHLYNLCFQVVTPVTRLLIAILSGYRPVTLGGYKVSGEV